MIPFAFMKKSVCLLAVCCAACSLAAQVPVWNNPSVGGEGKADSRPEFISYPTREAGETGDPANAPHYVSLAGKWRAIVSTTRQGGEPGFYKHRRPGRRSTYPTRRSCRGFPRWRR